MTFHELQSPEAARDYLLAGLALGRVVRPQPMNIRTPLRWLLEIASEGHPVPPPGFVHDLGSIVFGAEVVRHPTADDPVAWPAHALARYDDAVLGKLFSDRSLERAADALRRLNPRDSVRGLAYILERIRERTGLGGVGLGTGPIKTLLEAPPELVARQALATLSSGQGHPILAAQYQELHEQFRLAADLLGPEDIFELEQGTALAELGQRVAVRQVVRTAALLYQSLPTAPPPPRPERRTAATPLPDEDAYPVGGFSSLSNRGSTESLLHSQLAFMEKDEADRPDLFDVKFLRDELLYYSRDENQFYRRRRRFRLLLEPDLTRARLKDPDAPVQRIVLLLAAIVASIRKITEWLSVDALTFEIALPADGSLDQESEVLKIVFRNEIEAGTVRLGPVAETAAIELRMSTVATDEREVTGIVVDRIPVWVEAGEPSRIDTQEVREAWDDVTRSLAEYAVRAAN
ncbi:MAG: hypothetical protein K1X57_19915 [Gemmataceae bacterium]|nr:hypothetical protein [Gemmataceae bacterium]